MAKKTVRKKKPYAMTYTANPGTTPRRYLLSGIPPGLWIKFQARAKREHIAMRQVLLSAVSEWTNRPEEPQP
jgi:hypothetical protein